MNFLFILLAELEVMFHVEDEVEIAFFSFELGVEDNGEDFLDDLFEELVKDMDEFVFEDAEVVLENEVSEIFVLLEKILNIAVHQ